ncbi:peptidylprolyl isomerase [Methanobrevibacter curvatus]|uniref:Peptidyl-prolyl cis-trans isomerase n=1 Tax=Methanobrevibacter curvatus TaxID=49547 RepID=A0A165ZQL6_9EURY|nr:peptidylprolyl isomerase [Methanobrevibacter curvatus]KZX11034.1 FKBP-type peptidyl-prolyl cis-trans isomerase SlyD [Methanobrevibacter curvatus]
MAIENGDFVKIEFTGKVVETGDVFDTTSEEIAKEADIFDDKKSYTPLPIILGGGHLLEGLDKAIIGLNEGDSKVVTLAPEEAYGDRDQKLVQLMPAKEFKKQGMTPYPGLQFQAEGHTGKILTVSGGRVKVDFNNPLAGKTVEYSVVVNKVLDNDEDKIKSLIQLHYAYPNLDVEKTALNFDGKTVAITLDDITRFDQKSYMDVTFQRFRIAKDIYENLDYDNVQFVDEFKKPEDKPEDKPEVKTDDVAENLEETIENSEE